MIHYTCDRCQKTIESQSLRYIVKMEIAAEFEDGDETDQASQLENMQEILKDLDDEAGIELIEDVYQNHRFDLCSECYRTFKKNPLGSPILSDIRFSQN